MESEYVTTPFGRRTMSLGMLISQRQSRTIETGTTRNKWKLFRAVCEARSELGVSDRALTVLDALLTFFPHDVLADDKGLIVFPSNAQLCIRARGMTPATLRRHLAMLVKTGLIIRKDSPNGKRYARRDGTGQIHDAYGFSLSPLLARASEIEAIASRVVESRELLRKTRERVTICRRDITKLITTAMNEELPGHWEMISGRFRAVLARIPRTVTTEILEPVLRDLADIRSEIINLLENHIKTPENDSRESHIEHHIQDSDPEYLYEKKRCEEKHDGIATSVKIADILAGRNQQGTSVPIENVVNACPQIKDYGPGGTIRSWRDLISAAMVVRSMLGVPLSAWEEACSSMGMQNTSTVMACILESGERINCPGGYLRILARRAEQGQFTPVAMLNALQRSQRHGK